MFLLLLSLISLSCNRQESNSRSYVISQAELGVDSKEDQELESEILETLSNDSL
jgi:hypothetical protein